MGQPDVSRIPRRSRRGFDARDAMRSQHQLAVRYAIGAQHASDPISQHDDAIDTREHASDLVVTPLHQRRHPQGRPAAAREPGMRDRFTDGFGGRRDHPAHGAVETQAVERAGRTSPNVETAVAFFAAPAEHRAALTRHRGRVVGEHDRESAFLRARDQLAGTGRCQRVLVHEVRPFGLEHRVEREGRDRIAPAVERLEPVGLRLKRKPPHRNAVHRVAGSLRAGCRDHGTHAVGP